MSLYKDASLVMLPSAYKDGKLLSIKPVEELGDELVTNGDFDSDSDWTKGSGWTISGGKASKSGSDLAYLTQSSLNSVVGKTYKVRASITNVTTGNIRIDNFTSGTTYSGNVEISVVFTATTAGPFRFLGWNGFNGSIDNVSVKEVLTESGDFDFTRGSNLAATRVDVDGLIEKGRENLLLQSNQFDTTWIKNNSSVTSGQADKDGGTNAWLLERSVAFGNAAQNISQGGVQTFSVFAKAGTYDWVYLRYANASPVFYRGAFFNLSTGVVGTIDANVIDAEIESVGDGWYRCSITYNQTISQLIVYPVASDGGQGDSGTGNIYIQDAQLEKGLVATDYIETGASTAQAGILEDMPRLDYSGGASCPSLLLEPQRSNLFRNSEYFGYWTNYGGSSLTITPNYSDSPEGISNSYRLQKNAFSYARLDRTLSGVSSGTLTYSLFVKGDDVIKLRVDAPSETPEAFIDCSDGTTTNHLNNPWDSISSVDYGDGWYRFICTHTFTNAPTIARIYPTDSVYGESNTNAADVQVYGAQLEAGSYATSYIPTYGSSVTRNQENTSKLTLPETLTDNFTLFFDFKEIQVSGGFIKFLSSSNALVYAFYSYSNHFDVYNGSSFIVDTSADATGKIALTQSGSSVKVFVNGVDKTKSGATANTTDIAKFEFGLRNSGQTATLKQMIVFPTALTDAECIALTE